MTRSQRVALIVMYVCGILLLFSLAAEHGAQLGPIEWIALAVTVAVAITQLVRLVRRRTEHSDERYRPR